MKTGGLARPTAIFSSRGQRRLERVSSMPQLFNLILSVMLLMHTTFGCCVHHAHSSRTDCYERSSDCRAASSVSSCDHVHEHQDHESALPAKEYPCPQEEGCDGEMHILARTEYLPSELVVHFNKFTHFAAVEKYFQRGQTIFFSGPIRVTDGMAPSDSLRCHLLLGVLLI